MSQFHVAARGRRPQSPRFARPATAVLAMALMLPGGVLLASMPARTDLASSADSDPAALSSSAVPDDLVRYALENSPVVAAAYHRWRAATARVPQVTALPDPEFGVGFVFDEVDRSSEYMGERYSISQMLPWFGKRGLQGDMAEQEAEAAARRLEAARLDIVAEVTTGWFEYAWLVAAVATARENLALVLHLESVARAMYRAGEASQSDVTRAQVELGRLEDRVHSLQDQLGPAAARLNTVLGRPAHASLPAPDAPSRQAVAGLPEHDDETWLAMARANNPALAAYRHAAERERQSVALARRESYPDVMLGLEYGRDVGARMAMMDGGGRDMLVGMVSINVPIRRGRLDAVVSEARDRLAAAGRETYARELALENELKAALFAWREGKRRMHLYGGTLLPKARQSLAATETAYRAGEASFTDLIDAQRVLLEFQLAHERAAADRAQARARILALAGPLNQEQTP
jgi:outer membrane protein, heavy metal efflux system